MTVKAAFFSAPSHEEALKQGREYFGCAENAFSHKIIAEGNEDNPWLVLGLYSPDGNMEHMNGFFRLSFEEEGVFAEFIPPQGRGEPYDKNKIVSYVSRKGLTRMEFNSLKSLIDQGEGRVKIAPPQEEKILAEDAEIKIAKNLMTASICLLPPDPGGALLGKKDIEDSLRRAGVVFGIKEEVVDLLLNERVYGKTYIAAAGLEPQNGTDGVLQIHFKTERTFAPKLDDKDRVDYRELDLFEAVKAGQLLVSRSLASPGVPGRNIGGKEIKQRPGKEARMPKGKNVALDQENIFMRAAIDGMVDYVNGNINVSDVYVINGDVDMGVGNINFDGSIVVKGNVIAGMSLNAANNISIGGVVEGAEIIAGGDVELKRGIKGLKGKVTAGGSVISTYVERSTIMAGGDITADSIVNATIEAGGTLYAKGKSGNIYGGSARAGKEVIANIIGSPMETKTEVSVGVLPRTLARQSFLQKEIENVSIEYEKLNTLFNYLSKTPLDEKKKATFESVLYSKNESAALLGRYEEEMNALEMEIKNSVAGKVHVLNRVFPGVRIGIGSAMYKIDNEPISYATFKFKNGEIEFLTCELRK
jgi:uncharacterized protein (DUF342 family)